MDHFFSLLKKIVSLLIFLLMVNHLFSQGRQITGTIKDASDNNPLIGATIQIKETTQGTVTDIDGNYSLNVPEGKNILVFSFVGYLSQEISIDDQSRIDVLLAEDIQQLEEIVVIGYGTQKKSDLTGAVTTVSSEELTRQSVAGLDQALQGRAAGVQVTQS